jgi:hypothetical protein
MKKINLLFCFVLFALFSAAQEQKVNVIPDIPGYMTLKCDFHLHSIFSDGAVLPKVRVDEAIRENLDAIAVTEHIEYRPNHRSGDVTSDHNRAFVLASAYARTKPDSLIVIHGSEITRDMPPGHINALFVKDSNPLATPDWRDAIKAAKEQGAFIFWNHPAWRRQAPDGVPKWYDEHTQLYDRGCIMGIEIYGAGGYTALAHGWAADKGLALLGNTDAHAPLSYVSPAHRTMTLVFATERSEEGIREALSDRRTVAYNGDNDLCGPEDLLKALLEACLSVDDVAKEDGRLRATVTNGSTLTFELSSVQTSTEKTTIGPLESVKVDIALKNPTGTAIELVVDNMLGEPGRGMRYTYRF